MNVYRNPFSDTFEQPDYDTKSSDYGRPLKGSLTEKRGIKAGAYILNEVVHLCEIIVRYGDGPPEQKVIKFGPLFKIYEFYSGESLLLFDVLTIVFLDKVVGLLIRARKYKLLDFDGEMLYQRQDDHKPIVMLMSIEQIYTNVKYSGDPKNVVQVQQDGQSQKSVEESKPKAVEPPKLIDEKPKKPKSSNKVQQAGKEFAPGAAPRSSYYNFCT